MRHTATIPSLQLRILHGENQCPSGCWLRIPKEMAKHSWGIHLGFSTLKILNISVDVCCFHVSFGEKGGSIHGGAPIHHPFKWDFPRNKPSICGVAPWLWKPSNGDTTVDFLLCVKIWVHSHGNLEVMWGLELRISDFKIWRLFKECIWVCVQVGYL